MSRTGFRTVTALLLLAAGAAAQSDSTGIKLIEQRKFADAERFFDSAVARNGKDAEARYFHAIALMMGKDLDAAEDEVDEAIDLNENAAKYHLLRGQILGQQAMTANVISQGFLAPKIKNAFLRASELDPKNIEARAALFSYYLMAPGIMGGSDEKAMEQADAVERLEPMRGKLMRASYFLRKKDTARAEGEMKGAIAAAPEKGAGHKQLGYLNLNRKRYAEASSNMERYIALEPKNPDAYDSMGDVLAAQEKYDQAIERYLQALAVDRTFSPSVFALAGCYEKKNMKQKAKETYQWFLTLEQNTRRAETAEKKIKEL
ncbi:MAG: tetratricopeptide repeat protein [Bacteroidetes bacterium]|nr:MAG: tetratricopeptide repeat protein [Bacteroidota bacterium]